MVSIIFLMVCSTRCSMVCSTALAISGWDWAMTSKSSLRSSMTSTSLSATQVAVRGLFFTSLTSPKKVAALEPGQFDRLVRELVHRLDHDVAGLEQEHGIARVALLDDHLARLELLVAEFFPEAVALGGNELAEEGRVGHDVFHDPLAVELGQDRLDPGEFLGHAVEVALGHFQDQGLHPRRDGGGALAVKVS